MRRRFGRADHLQAAARLLETARDFILKGDEVNGITLARQSIGAMKKARLIRMVENIKAARASTTLTASGSEVSSPEQASVCARR